MRKNCSELLNGIKPKKYSSTGNLRFKRRFQSNYSIQKEPQLKYTITSDKNPNPNLQKKSNPTNPINPNLECQNLTQTHNPPPHSYTEPSLKVQVHSMDQLKPKNEQEEGQSTKASSTQEFSNPEKELRSMKISISRKRLAQQKTTVHCILVKLRITPDQTQHQSQQEQEGRLHHVIEICVSKILRLKFIHFIQ